jgi:hypothetical protein
VSRSQNAAVSSFGKPQYLPNTAAFLFGAQGKIPSLRGEESPHPVQMRV